VVHISSHDITLIPLYCPPHSFFFIISCFNINFISFAISQLIFFVGHNKVFLLLEKFSAVESTIASSFESQIDLTQTIVVDQIIEDSKLIPRDVSDDQKFAILANAIRSTIFGIYRSKHRVRLSKYPFSKRSNANDLYDSDFDLANF
jgi:hypothetical protein